MQRRIFAASAACVSIVMAAQNLVPNGGFEEYLTCPSNTGQIDSAAGWTRYLGTPDFFHSCSEESVVDVPGNFVGYQWPATGQGYAGLLTWNEIDLDSRELMGAQLNQSLTIGVPVYLSMRLSATNPYPTHGLSSASGIGIWFRTVPANQLTPLPNWAALHLDTVVQDTVEWIQLSGVFFPDSTYSFIVVGGAFSDSLISVETFDTTSKDPRAYMYVDDVCVSLDPSFCGHFQSVQVNASTPILVAYPNPVESRCTFTWGKAISGPGELTMYDALGRLSWSAVLASGSMSYEWQRNGQRNGVYSVKLRTQHDQRWSTKIVLATL